MLVYRLVSLCVALAVTCLPLAAQTAVAPRVEYSMALAPGVIYRHLRAETDAREPWSIHVLTVSRREKSAHVAAIMGVGPHDEMQRERPTVMAAQAAARGANVLAVVNGDFDYARSFPGVSTGLAVAGGRLWTSAKPGWPVLALLASGEPVIGVPDLRLELRAGKHTLPLAGYNKPPGRSGIYIYSREFRASLKADFPLDAAVIEHIATPLRAEGAVTGVVKRTYRNAGEVPVPARGLLVTSGPSTSSRLAALKTGTRVSIRTKLAVRAKRAVRDVIGGFPVLVANGRKHVAGNPAESLAKRHPRTAVCYNDRELVFAVVDGRQPKLSVGMTLDELADLMLALKCREAMNTDGGGSSVMAVHMTEADGTRKLRIVNSPSDGSERGRGNAWLIVAGSASPR
ncbi:MAG: phosphodiester glycosidase family protein [Terriglobales bacterium]